MVSVGHRPGIKSRRWSPQEIKCQVNGLKNQDPISMQIYLNKHDGDKGRQMLNILESHINWRKGEKKKPKAYSQYDLELGRSFPTLHVAQIRPGSLVQAGSKSL